MSIGERIKNERLAKGMSQTQLGKLCNAGKSAVSQWERGNIKNISGSRLYLLCKALEVSYSWLLTGKGDKHAITGAGFNEGDGVFSSPNAIQNECGVEPAVAFAAFLLCNSSNPSFSLNHDAAITTAANTLLALCGSKLPGMDDKFSVV